MVICSTAGSSSYLQKARTTFLINIATEQVAPLKAFLAEHQIVPESFYPVVRARLTAINDKPTEGNEDEALNRELNLTLAKYAARS